MKRENVIKIRWVTYWPVPYWTERFNVLAKRENIDLEVIFLSSASALLPSSVDKTNWQFRYKIVRSEHAKSGYYRVNRRLPKPMTLVRGDFSILIMPYGDPDCVAASILCAALHKKYWIFSANNSFDWRPSSTLREKLKHFIFQHSSGVLATGPSQKSYALGYMENPAMIHIIGNPAPALKGLEELGGNDGRSAVRSKLGWGDEFVILYVGRVSKEKGLNTLVRALEELATKNVASRTVIVGSGPLEADLKSAAKTRGLNVEFMGFREGVDLTEVYLAADVFVLPSTSEPWGLVVNEAMEAGLPVVVSDKVGSQQALVREGQNGLIFQAEDASALAQSILRLYKRRSELGDMSEKAREIIKLHTIEVWANNVINAVGPMNLER
ncbi:MAG: glycosyltransferase family 4 protein [Thiogranum sp.]|nr:glycosyltransferase family 4 protein [Thiogranum sp.]